MESPILPSVMGLGGKRMGQQSRRDKKRFRILLVEPDSYLAFLLHLDLPDAEVLEPNLQTDIAGMLDGTDLVILDLASSRASQALESLRGISTIGIVDGSRASRTAIPLDLEGVLVRPFVPAELYRAVRRALELPTPLSAPHRPSLERARSWLARARVAAVALTAVVEVATEVFPERAALLALAFAYSAFRIAHRGTPRWGALTDVALAIVLIAATGGPRSPYMAFGLVASGEAGLVLGMQWGALAGVLIDAGSAWSFGEALRRGALDANQLVAWMVLFPLVAVAAGLAARIWLFDTRGGAELLAEANRVLSSLYRIARAMPRGLEVESVTSSALEEVRENLKSPAGVLLLTEAGTLGVAGAFGLSPAKHLLLHRYDPLIAESFEKGVHAFEGDALPASLAPALSDYPCWLAAPMGSAGATYGVLLAACPEHSQHDRTLPLLERLGEDTTLALENARLFARIRELSVDEERGRLARDLHDGVAQALAHVRFELGFLARHGQQTEDKIRAEFERLTRVLDRALGEVRSTILGLDPRLTREGLAGSLRSYLRDLQGLGGPNITFEVKGVVRLAPELEAEAFRIAQEAVSNAFRHSRGEQVIVRLGADGSSLWLTVEDDGIGLRAGDDPSTGMGLKAMQERAERIGGRLLVEEKREGGTRVELVVDAIRPGNEPSVEQVRE